MVIDDTSSGLPVGARFETEELEASRTGYTYTATNDSGILPEEGITAAYVNTQESVLPTGVGLTNSVLLAAIARLTFLLVIVLKKNKKHSAS